ncbi:MAG: DNA adenine methylase [Treponemataceae bacterium]
MQNAQIECCDAVKIIKSRDSQQAFMYCDPPYVGSYQGHYDGYMQSDFDELLEALANLKGKFLLSSYRNARLTEYIEQCGWHSIELKMNCRTELVQFC